MEEFLIDFVTISPYMRIMIARRKTIGGVGSMLRRCSRGCGRRCCHTGPLLISAGIGILLAYIIPYHILITMFGIALIVAGIRVIRRH